MGGKKEKGVEERTKRKEKFVFTKPTKNHQTNIRYHIHESNKTLLIGLIDIEKVLTSL